MKKLEPQQRDVIEHLKRGESLTQLQALNLYGIGRLAAVVHDLRGQGYEIITDTKKVPTRGGRTAKVAEYRLAGVETQTGLQL